jgi:ABC-type glycerol-3-phosphate transport system substrate-binding protein
MVAWAETGERLPTGSRDIVEAFAESQRGVRLNLMYDRWPQAEPRMRYWSGSLKQYAPDLTVLRDVWLPTYAPSLLALDDLLEPKDLTALTPSVLQRCRVGGKLLGLPWRLDAQALYYRHDLLETAGLKPPTTLGELAAAATKLSQPPGIYGLGLPGLPGGDGVSTYLGLLHAFGGEPVDEQGAVQLASDAATRALAYWVEMARAGGTPPEALTWSGSEVEEAFAGGRIAMVLAGQDFGGG